MAKMRKVKFAALGSAVVTFGFLALFRWVLDPGHPEGFSLIDISGGGAYDWTRYQDAWDSYLVTHLAVDLIFMIQYTIGFLLVARWMDAYSRRLGWTLATWAVVTLLLDAAEDLLLVQHQSYPVLSALKDASFALLALASLIGIIWACLRERTAR